MSDEHEQGGITQKAEAIANLSATKSVEIVEGAEQIVGGDLRGGLAKILKAAGNIATGATEKGLEIAADVADKVKADVADKVNKPTETEPTETVQGASVPE